MGIEIERKFLVVSDEWKRHVHREDMLRQGYLTNDEDSSSIRVRVTSECGFLNIKSSEPTMRRIEYQYVIPVTDAEEMLYKFCRWPLIEKKRFWVAYTGHEWQIDVFEGTNEGLIVAELELKREDEKFQLPPWAGAEVTDDPRYYNVYLLDNPYTSWPENKRAGSHDLE